MDYGLIFWPEAPWICFLQTFSFSFFKTLVDGLDWSGVWITCRLL